jgi:hypothetical protein
VIGPDGGGWCSYRLAQRDRVSQLDPRVIQRLTKLIVTLGGVPLAHIDRFVLTNSLPGGDSGWNIYLTSGSTRFQSLVLGDQLVMITPSGPRAVSK